MSKEDIIDAPDLSIKDENIIEEEEEEGEEELGEYEIKEQEAREEIQEMFQELEDKLNEVRDNISKVISIKPEYIARKYRIKVDAEILSDLSTMKRLNELISESNVYLKNYVDLGDGQTPQFDYIKNLVFRFQESLNKEQNRRFAIVNGREGNYYITKFNVDYYLKPIHIWISKIIGTLRPAGDSAVIFPPSRAPVHDLGGMGGTGDGLYDDDITGGDVNTPYANSTDWWSRGVSNNNFYRRGTKTRPKLREFGDAGTK